MLLNSYLPCVTPAQYKYIICKFRNKSKRTKNFLATHHFPFIIFMFQDTYLTITQALSCEFKDKGSKFIAFASPVRSQNDIKQYLTQIKELHPKATHHCYAYRLGLDKLTNYRANDDGEPSGTAGKPILGQIDSKQLTNLIVIVVRYFGGTKLGVPGLINAYKSSTKMVLEQADIVEQQLFDYYQLQLDYLLTNDVMRILKREQVTIVAQHYEETKLVIDICFPRLKNTALLDALSELRGVKAVYEQTI
jgi:uncharacterized YigZ family protein